ncbi:DUF305 domain-containing protein [Kibdelosporangium aridum]|uniref:DUF305 domain-containing protein n=1 Tax=Kibdelosporangium aridum TaxID=2030 RepID=A0A428Z592_KIBAR|nr:DUF305 domain-containing protein [Kibdelosporangium aridum]RSM81995.1 DUF305 domain-containing protein [Kibdelosporangium aridum]
MLVAAAVLAMSILVGACGGNAAPSRERSGVPNTSGSTVADRQVDHNGHDIAFASQMIRLLSEVRDLAKLVPSGSADPKVRTIAARIMRSANPDIQQLMAWLGGWGVDYTGLSIGHTELIRKLEQSEQAQFDRTWADLTIERYQAMISLAETELDKGIHSELRRFARRVVDLRRADIAEIQSVR